MNLSNVNSDASMVNALRFLTIDAVQKANSGHPGMPMGMTEVATALWQRHFHHNPRNDQWVNRDRFVLSNGHGSMLLYSLLHLTGYDLPIDELKRFRQLHSKTPGHPEYGVTPGVDASTGPLGQGLGNAVGLALAERLLASEFNRAGLPIVDHYTYCFVGDGCLMEGISHEVCSLAGTWRLSKLIVFYDDNGISIDGHVAGWFTDNTAQRFAAYGWHVIDQIDGHDVEQVDAAIRDAKAQRAQPTIIICKTTIGKGAPNKSGSHDIHGAPLGTAEIAATRAALNWPHAPFELPKEIYQAWDARERGVAIESAWNLLFSEYETQHPILAAEFKRRIAGRLPDDFSAYAADCLSKIDLLAETIASRKSSQNALQSFAEKLPELLGGSADLAPSNLTQWKGCKSVKAEGGGNYLHYGVREFGMVAIMNGLLLHRGLRPFGGTFAVFSDYARNAMRMAALMKINPIYVLTHDSIALGEDGPTHQPVEQVASLRLIPNMDVWRPCDAVESAVAWQIALEARNNPTCLILSRQNLPHQTRSMEQRHAIARGAYILAEASDVLGALSAIIIATGSEVQLAAEAQSRMAAKGIAIRVVSMPSTFCFERQAVEYRERVLPQGVPRVVIEAGVRAIWVGWAGDGGQVIGVDTYGESAPADILASHFGMTVDALITALEKVISDR